MNVPRAVVHAHAPALSLLLSLAFRHRRCQMIKCMKRGGTRVMRGDRSGGCGGFEKVRSQKNPLCGCTYPNLHGQKKLNVDGSKINMAVALSQSTSR